MYQMSKNTPLWSHTFSREDGHIVMNEVEETHDGKMIAVPYSDDGNLRVFFAAVDRTTSAKAPTELNVGKLFEMKDE